ncbi:MAG: cohesin domain-containing protein [Lachnospiraceae bacterium]|nr:cohesin domain-containing protein [Lachnospiraceae bacterium]
MRNRKFGIGKTGLLAALFFLCFGMTAFASSSVEGDTELTAVDGETVSAEFTITSDSDMESATLEISYDKSVLTYISGSGGDNFSGSGGNGTVQLSYVPNDTSATFTVTFRGSSDEDTTLEILSCTIEVDGEEIDVLAEEDEVDLDEDSSEEDSDDDEDDSERASFVIDGRTFYVHHPTDVEGFSLTTIDIQGISSEVRESDTLEGIYLVRLVSDNGSYRDMFVYNPDTGNVIPYVQLESGSDTVIFIEADEDVTVPTRYSYVDLGWGAKYTLPAYKHVTIDGVDEIFDDTNRYLVYGINQDGEKGWYSYDYDTGSVQLFDEIAYDGEQAYITELEEKEDGLRDDLEYQATRYNTDMRNRLWLLLAVTLIAIVLLNIAVIQHFRIRKLKNPDPEEEEEEPISASKPKKKKASAVIVGNLEENETDFDDPESRSKADDDGLEIIDLDDFDDGE